MSTFVCTVRNNNFCIHCCIWQHELLTVSSIVIFALIMTLYKQLIFVCTIAVMEFNIKMIRNIYCNNMNSLIRIIIIEYHLLQADIVTYRASIIPKNIVIWLGTNPQQINRIELYHKLWQWKLNIANTKSKLNSTHFIIGMTYQL